MYIRKTKKIDPQTGKSYFSFHLVESTRTEKGPRQRILLCLGNDIPLPERDHPLLAQCIEEIVSKQSSFIGYDEKIEKLAHSYASQLIQRLSTPREAPLMPEPELITIQVESIEQSEPRTVGAEHLLLHVVDQLNLTKKLKELSFSEKQVALALGTIIARATNPCSERATQEWLENRSGLGELIHFDFKKSSLNHLYKISDILFKHKAELEKFLETTEKNLHGYQSTIALYDLTNTYMEGQGKSNAKARHGVSKEKRSDCPLVTLGLVINEHGFINRTSLLPGNAAEPKTLKDMIMALDCSESLLKPIIVLDAGISSEDNLKWLRENGYKYIVSAKQTAPPLGIDGELVPVGDLKNLVRAALIKSDGGEERWLHCESEAKAAVADQMKTSFKQRFEDDLKKLANGIAKPRGRKKYPTVLRRVGRLQEKHKRISSCYDITIIPSGDGVNAASITWKIIEEKMTDKLTGKYFLRTNFIDKSPKELWNLYNTIREVEAAFRFMKSSLGLRPVFHQKEGRVDGHLWITVLAYHLIKNCLYQLSKEGISHNWETIRRLMSGRIRVTTSAATAEGKTLHHRSTTKAEGDQIQIYKALRLSTQILKSKKVIL